MNKSENRAAVSQELEPLTVDIIHIVIGQNTVTFIGQSIQTLLLMDEFSYIKMHPLLTHIDRAPSNTSGMSWSGIWDPELIIHHEFLTSLMILWLNAIKSLQQCSNIQCKAFTEEQRLLEQQRDKHLIYTLHF